MNRRHLLLGGAALATVGVGALGLQLQPSVLRAPRRPLRSFTPATFSVFAAIADRANPAVDGFPSAWDLEVPEDTDEYLATVHPATVAELNLGLQLVESGLVGLLLDGRRRTFTALSGEAQDAVLHAWRTSALAPRKTAYTGLVKLAHSVYWGHVEMWPLIGYPGPPRFPA